MIDVLARLPEEPDTKCGARLHQGAQVRNDQPMDSPPTVQAPPAIPDRTRATSDARTLPSAARSSNERAGSVNPRPETSSSGERLTPKATATD